MALPVSSIQAGSNPVPSYKGTTLTVPPELDDELELDEELEPPLEELDDELLLLDELDDELLLDELDEELPLGVQQVNCADAVSVAPVALPTVK
jgi:hypothetical protein